MVNPPTPVARKSDSSFTFPVGNVVLAFPLHPAGPTSELTVVTPTGTDRVPRLEEPPALSPVELLGYAGKYWSDELQATYAVEMTAGKLFVHRPSGPGVELKLFAPDLFAANVGKLTFRRGTDGKVSGFKLSTSRSEGIEFVRVEK